MSTRLQKTKVGRRSTLVLHRTSSKKGHEGFEELKDFIKSGEDYCKEVSAVLQERAELEASYSRGLFKVAGKLLKASKECSGTVPNAWYFVANDFEQSAEIHKSIANIMLEEIAKPLKSFVELQYKTRKALEAVVEKRNKQFTEWKASQAKAKSKSYLACKDNEKVQDQLLDCKLGRGRQLSDKENLKLEVKRKKSEAGVRKSDMEYYASCIKTERSRLEWEGSIVRGSSALKRLEEDRLNQLANHAKQYITLMEEYRPKLTSLTDQLQEPVALCDVKKDIAAVAFEVEQEGMGEQVLPSFYCEDMVNVMNRERRREALAKFVGIVKADIERERKGRAGVENLAKALQETPKFGGEESQQEVADKLAHMQAMLTYLEATRFKLLNGLMDLEGRSRVAHPLASYLDQGKDKHGLAQTVLRIPTWVVIQNEPTSSSASPLVLETAEGVDWTVRGAADGVAEQAHNWSPSPRTSPPSAANHRHSLLLTAVDITADGTSPVFTTTNPILYSTHAEAMLMRGTADGGLEGVGNDRDDDDAAFSDAKKLLRYNNSSSRERGLDEDRASAATLPDSDFDEFDSNDEEEEEATAATTTRRDDDDDDDDDYLSGERGGGNNCDNSQDNEIHEIYYQERQVAVIGRCRAIYDYTANMYDELSIRYGDVINVHHKQEDGWWLGECDGKIGIFPATYVETI